VSTTREGLGWRTEGSTYEDDPSFEKLDFSGIRFPSDNLKIGEIRRVHSDRFDKGFDAAQALPNFSSFGAPGHHGDGSGMLLFLERLMVTGAYADRKGVFWPIGFDPEAMREDLAALYCTYGLARGPRHAAQLIRDLEREGARLASEKSAEL
jgi:hypothetical protein